MSVPGQGEMRTRDSSGARGGTCHGEETVARSCHSCETQPRVPVRLRCFDTCRAEAPRSPVTAKEGLVLHCLLYSASVSLENEPSPAQPCSAPHQRALVLLVRTSSSIRAGIMGKLRHRGLLEKPRSPEEGLCLEDTRVGAVPNLQEQGWNCWAGTKSQDLDFKSEVLDF